MTSWLGRPVPAEVRVASGDELQELIDVAERKGFSRRANDLRPRRQDTFALLAYLYESSPEASWMCLVTHADDQAPARPELTFGRVDVALADFTALRRAKRAQRDQLLHWTVWLASRGDSPEPQG